MTGISIRSRRGTVPILSEVAALRAPETCIHMQRDDHSSESRPNRLLEFVGKRAEGERPRYRARRRRRRRRSRAENGRADRDRWAIRRRCRAPCGSGAVAGMIDGVRYVTGEPYAVDDVLQLSPLGACCPPHRRHLHSKHRSPVAGPSVRERAAFWNSDGVA
jgi:hypothetical protein